jgi:hypothetical protein
MKKSIRQEVEECLPSNVLLDSFFDEKVRSVTKCKLRCEVHGEFWLWDTPLTPRINLIKTYGVECVKCTGKYRPSERENFDIVNSIIKADGLEVLDVKGLYKGIISKVSVRCIEHGDSSKWDNPWYATLHMLKNGGKCIKCTLKYKFSEREYYEEHSKKLNQDFNINLGTMVGDFKSQDTIYSISCDKHGDSLKWCNPYATKIRNIKRTAGCIKCTDSYVPTHDEAIKLINSANQKDEKNYTLTLKGFMGKFEKTSSKCIVDCSIHGSCSEWETSWNPTYIELKTGVGCPKCAMARRSVDSTYINLNKEEAISTLKTKCVKISLLNFIGSYSNDLTVCSINCREHGNSLLWRNPWKPKIRDLVRDNYSCLKCINKYRYTEEDFLERFYKNKDENIVLEGYLDDKYTNSDTKCLLSCEIHGKFDEWGTPSRPRISTLIKSNKISCRKCVGTYRYTKQEILKKINDKEKNGISFVSFVGEYKNLNSRCNVRCDVHEFGDEFGNKWQPTISDYLKFESGCPKCSKSYSYTQEESKKKILSKIGDNVEFKGYIGEYTVSGKTRCTLKCMVHNREWTPVVKDVFDGYGCNDCSIDSWSIRVLLKRKGLYYKDNNLYYVKFKNNKTEEIFYKIGISSGRVDERFLDCNLKRDGISIIDHEIYQMSNILSVLVERYVLLKYMNYRKPMYDVLKACTGGSECFGEDITKMMSIKDLILEATNNIQYIFDKINMGDRKEIAYIEETIMNHKLGVDVVDA